MLIHNKTNWSISHAALTLIGEGTDKQVYLMSEQIFKTVWGKTNTDSIEESLEKFFLPAIQFPLSYELSLELYANNPRGYIPKYGLIQEKCDLPQITNYKFPDHSFEKEVGHYSHNREFIKALIEYYSLEEARYFMQNYKGRAVSSRNWGYFKKTPLIFDYGEIK